MSKFDMGYRMQAARLLERIRSDWTGAAWIDHNHPEVVRLADELKARDIVKLEEAAQLSLEEIIALIRELKTQ